MGLKVTLRFSGGAELLVGNIKEHDITLEKQADKWTIQKLLTWIGENLIKERIDLFLQNKTIRPGILILINDADWELYDNKLEYEIEENDEINFISTLHGG